MYCEFIPGFGWSFLGYMVVFILENLLARPQLQSNTKKPKRNQPSPNLISDVLKQVIILFFK